MKICKACKFYSTAPAQVGPNQMAMVEICIHDECRNPVTGEPMGCGPVRSNESFCGIRGKYYSQRPLETTTAKETKDNVIQLIK